MMRNHYQALGVTRTASAGEIRTAYRKLAVKHHPDRSADPKSIPLFKAATEAYEVLGDPEARRRYDVDLGLALKRQAEAERRRNPFGQSDQGGPAPAPAQAAVSTPPKPRKVPVNLAEDLSRLSILFNRGRYVEAENLANQILAQNERLALPYAVLGDLARMNGRRKEAAKLYAFAVQMDPGNSTFQRRYEELLEEIPPADTSPRQSVSEPDHRATPLIVAMVVVLLAGVFVALSHERASFASVGIVSTWTFGLLSMAFVCGVTVGSCLSLARGVERFFASTTNSLGKPSPMAILSLLAFVNFWFAVLVAGFMGLVRRSIGYSLIRVLTVVGLVVVVLTLSSAVNDINPLQTLLWSGGVVYAGALCGWMVSDVFRS